MRVRAANVDGNHPGGWFGDMMLHAANPDVDGSEGECFDIPDKPEHNEKKCKVCRAPGSFQAPAVVEDGKGEPKCAKVGMPEAFSPFWMEEAEKGAKLSKRWVKMTSRGGMGAFAAAQAQRVPVVIGQDMVNGKKVI